jgi:hypothetical protein
MKFQWIKHHHSYHQNYPNYPDFRVLCPENIETVDKITKEASIFPSTTAFWPCVSLLSGDISLTSLETLGVFSCRYGDLIKL